MVFEILRLLWPFLKEFFLGKENTLGAAVKQREYKRVVVLLGVMLSITLNLYLVPKVVILADEVHKLKQDKREQDEHRDAVTVSPPGVAVSVPAPVATDPDPPASSVVSPVPAAVLPANVPTVPSLASPEQQRYDNLLSRMGELQNRGR